MTIDAAVKNVQFAVAVQTNATPGIMGVGYGSSGAILKPKYPNLIDQMFSLKLIGSRTFSLYLNDLDGSTGNILFGGVDVAKFSGTLHTLPVNPDRTGVASRFLITLTNVIVNTPNSTLCTVIGLSSSFPLNVVLDSGTSFTWLPTSIFMSIVEAMGASLIDDGYAAIDCEFRFAAGYLSFIFSGAQIIVPYHEIIVVVSNMNEQLCLIGILADDSGCGILGDTFLRSAYVVYDLVCTSFTVVTNGRIIMKSL